MINKNIIIVITYDYYTQYYIIRIIIIVSVNRGSLYAGCIGFAIGGGVGVVIGLCWQSPPQPLSYMRAVAATSFTGIDVSSGKNSKFLLVEHNCFFRYSYS